MDNFTRRQLIKKATVWHFNLGKGVITVATSHYERQNVTFYGTVYCSPADQFCKQDGKITVIRRLRETVNDYAKIRIANNDMTINNMTVTDITLYLASGSSIYYGCLKDKLNPLEVLRELALDFFLIDKNPNWVFKALKRGDSFEPRIPRAKRRKDKRTKTLTTMNSNIKITGTTLKKSRKCNGKARKNTPSSSTDSPT